MTVTALPTPNGPLSAHQLFKLTHPPLRPQIQCSRWKSTSTTRPPSAQCAPTPPSAQGRLPPKTARSSAPPYAFPIQTPAPASGSCTALLAETALARHRQRRRRHHRLATVCAGAPVHQRPMERARGGRQQQPVPLGGLGAPGGRAVD